MSGDLVVTAVTKNPEQGNVPVQSNGVQVFKADGNGEYSFQQMLAEDSLLLRCAVTPSHIFLQVAAPPSPDPTSVKFIMIVYEFSGSAWKQLQVLNEDWPSTGGIVQVNLGAHESGFLVVSRLYPYPENSGLVQIFEMSKAKGVFVETTSIAGVTDTFSTFPFLAVSIFPPMMVVSGFAGLSSNVSCATNVFYATTKDQASGESVWQYSYEMDTVLTTPVLGVNGLLATATQSGIDLYKQSAPGNGKFELKSSLVLPSKTVEYRGTKSLSMDPSGSFLVRGVGPYDYSSNTGCVVYDISSSSTSLKVTESFDTYSQKLTMGCFAGAAAVGMTVAGDQTFTLDIYKRAVASSQEESWSKVDSEIKLPFPLLRLVNEGIANNGKLWFFSQQHFLVATSKNSPLEVVLGPNYDATPKELKDAGYDHIGDIDVAEEVIYGGIEPKKNDNPGVLAKWSTADLSLISYKVTTQSGMPWVAVNVDSRLLYSAVWNSAHDLTVYDMDTFESKGFFTVPAGLPKEIQGGSFYKGDLYLAVNGNCSVWKIDMKTADITRVLSDLPYKHHTYEMEGIDFWDLSSEGLGVMHLIGNFQSEYKTIRSFLP